MATTPRPANNAIPTGVTYSSSDFKQGTHAFNFNGASYLKASNSPSLDIVKNITLSAWVKPTGVVGTQGIITKIVDGGTAQYGIWSTAVASTSSTRPGTTTTLCEAPPAR